MSSDVWGFIYVGYNEIRRSIERESALLGVASVRRKETINVAWKHPPMDWYALNSDGAAKRAPGEAGGGVIIWDHHGVLVSAISANFGRCSAFKAEVLALTNKDLELARELQINKLVVCCRLGVTLEVYKFRNADTNSNRK